MLNPNVRRLLDAYPVIYLACHRRHVRDDESGARLTAHQASILDHLDEDRAVTLSQLAEHLGIGRSAMSLMTTKLVRGGYIRRRRDGRDGRAAALTLTASGARVKQQNTVLDPDLARKVLGQMAAAEQEAALRGLEGLARSARQLLRRRARRLG